VENIGSPVGIPVDRQVLLIGEGIELVNETVGMDPAQAMLADIELTSIVTDDHRRAKSHAP
jgi:hypothetical protein